MTERLRQCLDDFRANTQCTASPEFTSATLDRLGLADRYTTLESVIGPVYVAWNPRGVSAVRQADGTEAFERWFRKRFTRRALPAENIPSIVEDVRRALAGEDVKLDIDLRDCTPFEAAVLHKAQEIPSGHARPYAWVARELDNPRAVRAVGSALANNPVPLLIPCHRVVRSDYATGEYVFGSAKKRELLEHEGLHVHEIEELAKRGIRYIGQPQDNCFCLPTCGPDLIADHNPEHVELHSVDEALAMGLEPCATCRPIAA
ncbi:MAG TPA: methylated-DNA--[protein]-cysteine S-methyltransferase [Candidatus Baltobacteraceae bacterium]|jgi:O-6-methylguanine DNA methyltransferase